MYQELTIVGTMGRDPEIRYSPDGRATATISVATNRSTSNGMRETTWFRVVCWEKTAEYMSKYAQKGTRVLARGRLLVDQTTGGPRVFVRNDGKPGAVFEVAADTVKLISGYKTPEGAQQPQTHTTPQQQSGEDEEIPW